jgi:hypothetical protein
MKAALLLATAFLLGAGITLAAVLDNADTLYAWHWRTFTYKGEK